MSKEALARRRMLLKSLGKGSAALAAASVPMHTLASSPTLRTVDGTRCSISGMQSGNNSRNPSASGSCRGNSPSYWSDYVNWTDGQKKEENTLVGQLFGDSAFGEKGVTLRRIVCGIENNALVSPQDVSKGKGKGKGKGEGQGNASTSTNTSRVIYNGTDEWHWCCAWMNAMAKNQNGVVNFPYSPEEVINFYRNPTVNTPRKEALAFFELLEN
jgi:hypothetical protein